MSIKETIAMFLCPVDNEIFKHASGFAFLVKNLI